MPEDVQICIAESSGSNIRELKSAVTNVSVKMKCGEGSDITVDDVRKLLENHFSGGPSKRLTADDIPVSYTHLNVARGALALRCRLDALVVTKRDMHDTTLVRSHGAVSYTHLHSMQGKR